MGWILPLIGIGLSAGGTAASAVGQVKAGSAVARVGELNAQDILDTGLANAQEAEYQAANVLEATQLAEKQERYKNGIIISHGKASIGASGLTLEGSPLDVLVENTRQAELNALEIRRGGQIQAESIRRQQQADIERAAREAQLARAGGQAQATRENYGAASTILGGGYAVGKEIADLARTSGSAKN